jgi:hypothetical protein
VIWGVVGFAVGMCLGVIGGFAFAATKFQELVGIVHQRQGFAQPEIATTWEQKPDAYKQARWDTFLQHHRKGFEGALDEGEERDEEEVVAMVKQRRQNRHDRKRARRAAR